MTNVVWLAAALAAIRNLLALYLMAFKNDNDSEVYRQFTSLRLDYN